jgi:hypothetical protein
VEKEKKTCRLIQKLPTLYQGDQTSLWKNVGQPIYCHLHIV